MKRAFLAATLGAAILVGAAAASGPSLTNPSSLHDTAPATFSAKFVTTEGSFVIKVTRSWSPRGADRFYNLVKYGYYDDQPLFRVISHYVAQWGINMTPKIAKAWQTAYIKDEPVLHKNARGTVTFANAGKNTRTTQIFVNLTGNYFLDSRAGFSPFGEVTSGLPVFGKLYHGYGEYPANAQNQTSMTKYGKWWVKKYFPKLDWIKTARLLP